MVRRDPIGIRLITRGGHDCAPRYPLIVEAMNHLKVRSCLIDGEAVCCDDNGVAVFERLRRQREGRNVFLCAFDLLVLNGKDLRGEPLGTEINAGQLATRSPSWLAVQSDWSTPATWSSGTPAPWDSKALSASD